MTSEYRPPTLTVDCVIFQLTNGELEVLLIKRTAEPFRGVWALPGGYSSAGETTREALARVLSAKAGLEPDSLTLVEQLYAFDTVARDPRGHAVSVTYMGLGRMLEPLPSATTQTPRFFPVRILPELAYDHVEIIQYAHDRLRTRINATTAISALLPERFTLSALQSAYEVIVGHPLDKRNFRKKFLSFGLLVPTDERHQGGAHRPALLYRFAEPALLSLVRSFE